MNTFIEKIKLLRKVEVAAPTSNEAIASFEDKFGLLDLDLIDLLLWSNGVKFDNYFLDVPFYNEYAEREGTDGAEFDYKINLRFDHIASIEAIVGCIEYANEEVSTQTEYDLNSEQYFINKMYPVAYDVTGRDYVCVPFRNHGSGVYLVNWWHPGAYRFLPFPQLKIADSLSHLVDLLIAANHEKS